MAVLLISLFWLGQPGNAQIQTGEQPLVPGAVVEREIAKDQSHRYSIYLTARQSLRIAATQKYGQQYQTNLALTALSPNGQSLTEVNLYSRDEGTEVMTIFAETEGVYIIVLSLYDNSSSLGTYQLQAAQPQPATAEDEQRMKAQNAFQTANKLRQTPNRENKLKAIELAESAQRSWQTLGEALWEGESLHLIGMTLRDLSRQQEAITYFNRAVPLIEKSGARFARTLAAHNICQAYYDLAQYSDCLSCKQSALEKFRELQETGYAQAVQDSLGPVYAMLGERDLALHYFNLALAFVRSKGMTRSEARTLSNFGVFHIMMNEYQQALDYYEQSLIAHRKSDFPHEAAGVNFNLGALYYRLNDDAKAAEYYQESLKLYRQTGNVTGICAALNGLALIEAGARNYPKMLEHLAESLSLARQSQLIVEEAMALIYHNWAYSPLKQWDKAREVLQQGLALCRKTDNRQCEILALGQLGQVMLELKETAEAKTYFDQLRQTSHSRQSVSGESIALSGLASVAMEENQLSQALQLSGQSLELIESTRGKIFKSDLRASFFAAQQSSYQKQIEILLRLHEQEPEAGYAGQALSVSERARARNLLDTLT
ncbi:MAG: tetratricopeptide repeat protein, partial [Blastocatellia bacterium]